jgi:hypothetical protein
MPSNFDLYKNIHKGQRLEMSRISELAGRAEQEDHEGLVRLNVRMAAFRDELRNHAHMEELYVHPLLAQRVPGGARKLEEDHALMHQQMDDLTAMMGRVTRSGDSSAEGQAQLHELYLAWNRFVAFYLEHIDSEEEKAQTELWRLCTDTEVRGIFGQIVQSETPEQLATDLGMMLPALSRGDRLDMVRPMGDPSPEMLRLFSETAQRVLSAEDYSDLKGKLNLP